MRKTVFVPALKESTRKILSFLFVSYHIFRYKIQVLLYKNKSMNYVFSDIHKYNRWGSKESVSGGGSDLRETLVVIKKLPILLDRINVRSMLDAPCGDFHWMKEAKLNLKKYIGCDIVADLISENQRKYENEIRKFVNLNLATDKLPQVDLILCRDCLVHLSFKDAIEMIKNFKRSGATYLLATTYPQVLTKNQDITTGDWRAIDLQLPPYNFPKPIEIINEETTEPTDMSEKSLGLWKLSDINL
jgi:hypothetical protein